MLGYAKLFKEKVHAEAKEEVYNELRQAVKEGKTLKDVLKNMRTDLNQRGKNETHNKN